MTTATITDIPKTLISRFGTTIPFSVMQGLYWDGMDWCYRGEVIPTEEDVKAINNVDSTDGIEWKPTK